MTPKTGPAVCRRRLRSARPSSPARVFAIAPSHSAPGSLPGGVSFGGFGGLPLAQPLR